MDSNTNKQRLDCEIVRDLLPLYHDGIVSETTKIAVEEHLQDCGSCRGKYEGLCEDLPLTEGEPSTGKQFAAMMHRQKRRRLFITVTAAVLSCVLLVAVYYGLTQIPIVSVPDDEITVYRVYRYETDEGYKFFYLYSIPAYRCPSMGNTATVENENGKTLAISIKIPLIAEKYEETTECTGIFECGYESGDNGTVIFENYSAVEFGGRVVWSEAENGKDEIPGYVYAYNEFENPLGNVVGWNESVEEGWLGAQYSDGREVHWDLDGNVLYDSGECRGEESSIGGAVQMILYAVEHFDK